MDCFDRIGKLGTLSNHEQYCRRHKDKNEKVVVPIFIFLCATFVNSPVSVANNLQQELTTETQSSRSTPREFQIRSLPNLG